MSLEIRCGNCHSTNIKPVTVEVKAEDEIQPQVELGEKDVVILIEKVTGTG